MHSSLPPSPAAPTILIIDDTSANVALLAEHFGGEGWSVMVAQDGEEGIERARFAQPDLILLDVMMPGIGGFATCERLKAADSTRDIPVIFMTALSDIGDKINAYRMGGVDYVTKPFHADEVLARVRTHLQLRAQHRQLQLTREQLEHTVAERTAELRQLAARSEAVREEERKALTRELHDEMGQSLSALRLGVGLIGLEYGAADSSLQAKTRRLVELVDTTIKAVRDIVAALRPAALDMGVVPALEWLADEFAERTRLACRLRVEGEIALDEPRATALFRIVQESLTNVGRHARATEVAISLARGSEQYCLQVRDNGNGFTPAARKRHSFGLVGIRERALALGGEAEIASAPGAGTLVNVCFPIIKEVAEP